MPARALAQKRAALRHPPGMPRSLRLRGRVPRLLTSASGRPALGRPLVRRSALSAGMRSMSTGTGVRVCYITVPDQEVG